MFWLLVQLNIVRSLSNLYLFLFPFLGHFPIVFLLFLSFIYCYAFFVSAINNRQNDRSLSYFKEFHQQLCALTGTWGLVELSLQLGAFCCVLCMKFWPHTDLFLNLWLPLTNKYLFACVCWRIFINHGYPETDKNLNCSRLSDKQGEKRERMLQVEERMCAKAGVNNKTWQAYFIIRK